MVPQSLSEQSDRLHVTAVFDVPVTVALNWCVPPSSTLTADSVTATLTGTWCTSAEPDFVGSNCSLATTVTVASLGMDAGAVYIPDAVMVPQPVPVQLHVTAVEDVFVTVAVNC
jgi:hypothetical protein